MVVAGLTLIDEPLIVPTPLSIDTVGTGLPLTVQDKVLLLALVMDGGEAVKLEIVGGVKGTAWVVAEAGDDWPELLPAAS